MRRITALAMALMVPALLTGCEDDDGPFESQDELVGDFQANDFGFTSTVNQDLVRDFDQAGATFTLELNENRTFETTFEAQGTAPFVRTGTFTTVGNEITLGNRGLFPGTQDVSQRFTFERVGNTLTLRSVEPMGFDFNQNATFEPEEAALFTADLQTF